MKKFNTVVCGGTFDHFHKGHKKLLGLAVSTSNSLVIGITSDKYLKKVKNTNQKFEDFKTRKKTVEDYLSRSLDNRFNVLEIDDVFGPTLNKDFFADAIVVSEFTKRGAREINKKRKEKGLKEFKILTCPSIEAEDNKRISSTRIRNGEIDREGKLYIKPVWLNNTLFLPQKLRDELKMPLGSIVTNISRIKLEGCIYLITVGDETTKVFNSLSIKSNLAVIDFKVARKKNYSSLEELGFSGKETVLAVKNPSGSLTPELFKVIFEIFQKINDQDRTIILIDGEEDLSVLPLILASPLGSCIFYGQPNKGIIKIIVDEKIKAKARRLIDSFTTRGY